MSVLQMATFQTTYKLIHRCFIPKFLISDEQEIYSLQPGCTYRVVVCQQSVITTGRRVYKKNKQGELQFGVTETQTCSRANARPLHVAPHHSKGALQVLPGVKP